MTGGALFVAVFLACAVEAVEALTIVLAAGSVRGWGSVVPGIVTALATLVIVTAILGPALVVVPLGALRLLVGALLLIFGLQWLRKAVLRASGHKDLHDETAIFETELETARTAPTRSGGLVRDWYAFTLSFKCVLLEGLEVAFIAVTFGSNQHDVPLAALAAGCAIAVVTAAGFAVRGPLARVPENALKFVVGVMLTAFGTFWSSEGAGAEWPGSDTALVVLAPAIAVFALALVALLRRRAPQVGPTSTAQAGTEQ